jgi:hypothetical protein
MASGSHKCKPNWADLPTAPINKKKQIRSIFATQKPKNNIFSCNIKGTNSKTTTKSTVLKVNQINMIANIKKISAILFITIAFIAALLANKRLCQKLINK